MWPIWHPQKKTLCFTKIHLGVGLWPLHTHLLTTHTTDTPQILLIFEPSPSPRSSFSSSLSQSHNLSSFSHCLILIKIPPQLLVLLSLWALTFLKPQWGNGFYLWIASLHTHPIHLRLKFHLTDSFCLCGPSKVHCNPHPPACWLSLHCGPMRSWHHPPHPHSTSCIQCSSPTYFASFWTFISTFIFVIYNYLDTSSEFTTYSYGPVTETPQSLKCSMKSLSVPKLSLHKNLRVSSTYIHTKFNHNIREIWAQHFKRGWIWQRSNFGSALTLTSLKKERDCHNLSHCSAKLVWHVRDCFIESSNPIFDISAFIWL